MHQAPETLEPMLGAAAMAWFGNSAKMRIVARITAERRPKTVLDFGAGVGGGWPAVLRHHPEIELVCFEPDRKRAEVLRRNVPAARIYERDPAMIAERADIVVSFSVFEHVVDRAAYLAHARRFLQPGGTLFLSYDDGHFRLPASLGERVRNRFAPILKHPFLRRHYQARVCRCEADRLITVAGFAVIDDRYENLASLKALARTVETQDQANFAHFWLEAERRLNADFARTGTAYAGDAANLWREMCSRSLELAAI